MALPFQQSQLEFMVELARIRTPILDQFFIFLNYFDTPYFSFFFISLIWIGFSYRWGLRLFYLLLFNFLVNGALKVSFGWNRPCADLSDVGLFCFKSPGFPSGGAQTAFLLSGLLIYYQRSALAWIGGGIYFALISFSRLYLGVHYPLDVVGGWVFGAVILCLFIRFIEPIEQFLKSQSLFFSFVLGMMVAAILFLSFPNDKLLLHALSVLAVSAGTYFSLKYDLYLEDAKTAGDAIRRVIFSWTVLPLVLIMIPKEYFPAAGMLMGLWVSLIASPIFKKLQRRRSWFG